jgi:hypothetical protein
MGFHISDFAGDQSGFTRSDFDDLVQRGVLRVRDLMSEGAGRIM